MSKKDEELFSLDTKRYSIPKTDLIKELKAFKKYFGEKPAGAIDYQNWKTRLY